MLKLLIAVRSGLLASLLTKSLSSRFVIHSCNRSTDTQRLIETMRPDVLVIDLRLDERDGLSILRNCSYRPPAILVLTDLINQEIMQCAATAKIGALVLIPCSARYVVDTIERIVEKVPSPEA